MRSSRLCGLILFCVLPLSSRAVISSGSVENINAIIPDGNLNGIQSSLTLSGLPNFITDVNVTLTVSGGFNGDFYAYLFHNGASAILLNRVGRNSSSSSGYSDLGFAADSSSVRFTLDDQAGNDVHFYRNFSYTLNGGALTGTWQADGRAIDPLSSGSAFDAAGRSRLLSQFNGADPNGTWSLFIADTSSGSEGTLINWGITVTAVPEPSFAGLLLLASLCAFVRRRTRRVD